MQSSRRFALVAGETSGDLLAGLLLGGMRQRWPDFQGEGIGGPRIGPIGEIQLMPKPTEDRMVEKSTFSDSP